MRTSKPKNATGASMKKMTRALDTIVSVWEAGASDAAQVFTDNAEKSAKAAKKPARMKSGLQSAAKRTAKPARAPARKASATARKSSPKAAKAKAKPLVKAATRGVKSTGRKTLKLVRSKSAASHSHRM